MVRYIFPSCFFFWLVYISNSIEMSKAHSGWQDQNEISDMLYGTTANYWNFPIRVLFFSENINDK